MVEKLASKILSILKKDNAIDDEIYEAYEYGMQILIVNIIGILISLFIGLIMSSVFETVIFLISFVLTRRYCGGYHTSALWKCLLTTGCMIISTLVINKYFLLSKPICIIISVIALMLFANFAPIENENKPLEDFLKIKNKILSLIILILQCIIGYVLLLFDIDIYNIIFISIAYIALFIFISIFKERSNKNEKSVENDC